MVDYTHSQNDDLPLVTFLLISVYGQAKTDLIGQIYCTFPLEKPMIVCNIIPTINERAKQLSTLMLSSGYIPHSSSSWQQW